MAYPDYPNNRLIVGGVDLTERFKMVLADGYTLSPPEPKTYTVDIPGGNSSIDLTESLFGDVTYKNRTHEFVFYVIDVDDFEKLKKEVSNFLHGKAFDYKITMDPNYIYHGRFSVTEYNHAVYSNVNVLGCIKISIDAKPFKHLERDRTYRINAIGGTTLYFESGRERSIPTIETDGYLKVIKDSKVTILQQGSWKINDFYLKEGTNEIYFNSYDIKNLTWGDLVTERDSNGKAISGTTWGEFKNKPLYKWYKSKNDGTYVMATWLEFLNSTWEDVYNRTWGDYIYKSEDTEKIKDSYIQYKVGDL